MQNHINELGLLIAELERHIPGWCYVPYDAYNETLPHLKSASGTMQVSLSLEYPKYDRVNIGVGWRGWPTYKVVERGNEETKRVTPHDLGSSYSFPSITVAVSRGAAAIAKEIQRRFLPEYERVYQLCAVRAKASQEYEDTTAATWKAVCALVNANPEHGSHYISSQGKDGNLNITMERSGGDRVHLKFYASAEQVARVFQAMGALPKS